MRKERNISIIIIDSRSKQLEIGGSQGPDSIGWHTRSFFPLKRGRQVETEATCSRWRKLI